MHTQQFLKGAPPITQYTKANIRKGYDVKIDASLDYTVNRFLLELE